MVALCLLVMEAEATAAVWGPGTTSLGTGSPPEMGDAPKGAGACRDQNRLMDRGRDQRSASERNRDIGATAKGHSQQALPHTR